MQDHIRVRNKPQNYASDNWNYNSIPATSYVFNLTSVVGLHLGKMLGMIQVYNQHSIA